VRVASCERIPHVGDFFGVYMAGLVDAAISAPRDERAVIVFESGVTVSLDSRCVKSSALKGQWQREAGDWL
jgi:hypothetical protein